MLKKTKYKKIRRTRFVLSIGKKLFQNCGNATKKDKILVIYENKNSNLAKKLKKAADLLGLNLKLKKINQIKIHGQEPPQNIKFLMCRSDLIICLTKMSLAHTKARHQAKKNGARFLSLPDFDLSILKNKAMQTDFRKYEQNCLKITKILSKSKKIQFISKTGTDLILDLNNRQANCCPGFVSKKYALGSPPDVEVNIAPQENKSQGTIVADISIPHPKIGLLKKPVLLQICNGQISNIFCSQEKTKCALLKIFKNQNNKKSMVLAEFGIGLNKKAVPNGRMLIDEGAFNTIHFGFGSNSTIGGRNKIPFHLDFVCKIPAIFIDGKKIKFNYD